MIINNKNIKEIKKIIDVISNNDLTYLIVDYNIYVFNKDKMNYERIDNKQTIPNDFNEMIIIEEPKLINRIKDIEHELRINNINYLEIDKDIVDLAVKLSNRSKDKIIVAEYLSELMKKINKEFI